MVFAVRDPSDVNELTGLPEMVVDGLADEDARWLLESAVPGRLDEHVRDQIVAETRGNPFALLELPVGATPAQLAGGFALPTRDRWRAVSRRRSFAGLNRFRWTQRLVPWRRWSRSAT